MFHELRKDAAFPVFAIGGAEHAGDAGGPGGSPSHAACHRVAVIGVRFSSAHQPGKNFCRSHAMKGAVTPCRFNLRARPIATAGQRATRVDGLAISVANWSTRGPP